jgi:multidrug efflux pump subunit AcrA (membrane-fusion protein)
LLTHHLHHQAALDQASATREAATEGVAEAKAEVDADEASVDDALAGVKSAEASTTYWKTELPREHKLADAGAVSLQDYQNEQNQAAAATAALAQANAKVDEAKQTVNSAKAKVLESSRQAAAADAGARMAVADLTVAEAQIGQTVAGAESAKASQREAQIIEGYARIVSPTAGVVTERPVAPGTLVQPGQEILKVEEIDRVRVQANVAVTDLSGITIGSPVTIITQEGESSRTIFAHVSAIFPAANAETRTAVVEAVVANPGRKLLPGAFVSMKLSTGARNTGLLVPSSAIVSQGGVSSVWAVVGQSASPSTVYVCSVCHMHYSASQAAKLHYVDPMDGGKLLPPAGGAGDTKGPMTVQQFPVSVLGSDGLNSEISADGILPGMEVVAHGADGLTDGAQVVQAAWGADGPIDLPSNSQASSGQQLYRCSKCGMTFSAANAKKDGYIDPMDGGKLLPVSGGR